MLTDRISSIGAFQLFLFSILKKIAKPPFRRKEILAHIFFIGVQSLGIVVVAGFFTGAVFGLQIGGIFSIFRAEGLMGGATGIALASELAPLVTGFLLAGKVGSAITAEIASMVVGEQIDAIESMGVDPLHYLVVPRVIASLLVMPLLCGLFMFIGVFGAFCSGVFIFDVDQGVFFDKLVYLVQAKDVFLGLRKMFVFAFLISAIACQSGLKTTKGAKGVGVSTTKAVVKMLVLILFADFLISYFEIRWLR